MRSRISRLAALVFRSALTAEHAQDPQERGLFLVAAASGGAGLRIIRGELAWARISRRELVYGRSVWILTMMQSCASAGELRAAGPFFQSASMPRSNTASRHLGSSIRQSAEKPAC